jgi:hypothetical protein
VEWPPDSKGHSSSQSRKKASKSPLHSCPFSGEAKVLQKLPELPLGSLRLGHMVTPRCTEVWESKYLERGSVMKNWGFCY